jgi:hypothetical protein
VESGNTIPRIEAALHTVIATLQTSLVEAHAEIPCKTVSGRPKEMLAVKVEISAVKIVAALVIAEVSVIVVVLVIAAELEIVAALAIAEPPVIAEMSAIGAGSVIAVPLAIEAMLEIAVESVIVVMLVALGIEPGPAIVALRIEPELPIVALRTGQEGLVIGPPVETVEAERVAQVVIV